MLVANLVYLEGTIGYTWLHTVKDPPLLQTYTLKAFEAKLPATCFIRLHRRYLVNRLFIHRLEREPKGIWVYLTTGMRLPVSRRQYIHLYQQLQT